VTEPVEGTTEREVVLTVVVGSVVAMELVTMGGVVVTVVLAGLVLLVPRLISQVLKSETTWHS